MAVFNLIATAALWLMVHATGIQVPPTGHAPAAYRLVAAIAGSIALVVTYWAAVRFGEKRAVPELDLRRAPSDLLLGLGIGAALLAAIVAVQWLFGWVIIEPRTVDRVALALRDSIRSGVLEELVLRLVIFRMLWRAFGIWPAIAGAALVFGLLHAANPDSSPFAVACLIAGEGIGIGLYLITGRIWSAIGMHAAWNFTQGWIFGAAVSGITDISGGPLALHPAPGRSGRAERRRFRPGSLVDGADRISAGKRRMSVPGVAAWPFRRRGCVSLVRSKPEYSGRARTIH